MSDLSGGRTSGTRAQAVFLGGVNVGGITVKSALLKSTLLQIEGVETARSVQASGNVLVTGTLSDDQLQEAAEKALAEAFDYDAFVVVVGREHLAELVAATPYSADSDQTHSYITFANDPAALDGVVATAEQLGQGAVDGSAEDDARSDDAGDTDEAGDHAHGSVGVWTRLAPEALAWETPVGTSTTAPLATLLASPKIKHTTTTRNVRTLRRLLDLEV